MNWCDVGEIRQGGIPGLLRVLGPKGVEVREVSFSLSPTSKPTGSHRIWDLWIGPPRLSPHHNNDGLSCSVRSVSIVWVGTAVPRCRGRDRLSRVFHVFSPVCERGCFAHSMIRHSTICQRHHKQKEKHDANCEYDKTNDNRSARSRSLESFLTRIR